MFFFCIEGTIFYASGQELLTLPEHLSSPTDFDHHLQTLLVNCRRRSHLILYLDDERNCGFFCIQGTIFYASGTGTAHPSGAAEFTHGFRSSSTDFIG
jgi:hypothetical protein